MSRSSPGRSRRRQGARRRPQRESRWPRLGPLRLHVSGLHNLQNALAAVTVGLELDLPFERIADALTEFRGVERRFDVRGEPNGILSSTTMVTIPTEIAAVLEAAAVWAAGSLSRFNRTGSRGPRR